jgi:energy-coupling factor transport system substrate-specific component
MPVGVRCAVYPLITGLHGVLFGTLYSPAQALLFGLDFDGMIAWIIAGLPFDLIHGVGNMCLGFLVYPLSELLFRLSGERRVK